MHGRLDLPDLVRLYEEFNELPLVSISDAQRAPPRQNWVGQSITDFLSATFGLVRGRSYLAFLGRISREKRVDRAIEIAKACGRPLKIAAKIDPSDVAYFKNEIAPLMDHPLVEFIGEIDDRKARFLDRRKPCCFRSTGPNHSASS